MNKNEKQLVEAAKFLWEEQPYKGTDLEFNLIESLIVLTGLRIQALHKRGTYEK